MRQTYSILDMIHVLMETEKNHFSFRHIHETIFTTVIEIMKNTKAFKSLYLLFPKHLQNIL